MSRPNYRGGVVAALAALVLSGCGVSAQSGVSPTGYTDWFNPTACTVSGWAVDADSAESLTIQVYRSGEIGGGGVLLGSVLANQPRGDGLPGYALDLPVGFTETVYAYAIGIDATGTPDGETTLLPLYTPNVPSRLMVCDTAPDSTEGVMAITIAPGVTATLGPIQPLLNQWDAGIYGATPDGRVGVVLDGDLTKAVFTCSDGAQQYSCLSETPSVAAFGDLAGLLRNPTGTFQPVMDPGVPGDPFQGKYAGLMSTWRDPATGIIHGWYHAEIAVPGCAAGFWASIGYAQSVDGGHSFTKYGPVISSPLPVQANHCGGQGDAEPNLVLAASGSFLYLLYEYYDPLTYTNGGLALARASMQQPSVWTKYGPKFHGSNWNESGLGGAEHPVIAAGASGLLPWFAGASFNTYLGKYLMFSTDYTHEGDIYARTSSDLITWSAPRLVMAAGPHSYRYPTLLSTTDQFTGQSGWLYLARRLTNQDVSAALLARRSVTLTK